MNRIIFQVLLVIVSVALFFTVSDPIYRSSNPNILSLKTEIGKYDEALTKSEDLLKEKDELVKVSNGIKQSDQNNLIQLLPDSVDNIRLLIDISDIAARYGLVLKSPRVAGESKNGSSEEQGITIGGNDTVGSVTLSFSVIAKYDVFKQFLSDLEHSRRLLDVTKITVSTGEASSDFYNYDITLKTYWLR